jgi:hypothetical protein
MDPHGDRNPAEPARARRRHLLAARVRTLRAFRVVARALDRIAENEVGVLEGPQVGRRGVGMPTGVRIGPDGRCTGVRVHLTQPASVRPRDLRRIGSRCHSQNGVQVYPGS